MTHEPDANGSHKTPSAAATAELFDRYARSYRDTVQRAISASGESVEYFAVLKVEQVRRALGGTEPARILDFGCGIGVGAALLASQYPRADIVGVDPSAESIAMAELAAADQGRPITFVRNTGHTLPFDAATFDLAYTACVFHHIPIDEHLQWARELYRTLRPGGSLMIFEHNPLNPLTRKVVRDCPFDEGVELLFGPYTTKLLKRAGFLSGKPRYYSFFPRWLRRLRPIEPALSRVPLGGQYYVHALKPTF